MEAKLKKRRLLLGWTQEQVARLAGCDRSYLSRLERGQIEEPQADYLARIEEVLGLRDAPAKTDELKSLHAVWCRDLAPGRKVVTHDMY